MPPGVAFLPALARAILAGDFPVPGRAPPDPLALANWTVLLPTRRAARAMAEAFLDAADGRARLLPRLRALGDVDEDELLFASEDRAGVDIPPGISPMQRLFLLTSLIVDWARRSPQAQLSRAIVNSPVQAFSLARSLAQLIDSFETEGVEFEAIRTLFDGELPRHQELALGFLDLVRVRLPAEMGKLGLISPAERRNRLMAEEAGRLAHGRAAGPVIAAGSTGSVPATARLLSVIARLEKGAVVLPGLDQQLDEQSWSAIGPQHPQFGMRELLKRMGVERHDVLRLPGVDAGEALEGRAWLVSEIMRPAKTTHRWREVIEPARLGPALQGITALPAPGQREEAAAIALIMRRTLETPGRTAALVTADRRLARRVKAELGRWNIAIDDSAGEPLLRTPLGAIAALVAEAAATGFGARELVALFNHPFSRFGYERRRLVAAAADLEIAVLRGRPIAAGFKGLAMALERAQKDRPEVRPHPLAARIGSDGWNGIRELVSRLIESFGPLETLFGREGEASLTELATAHIQALEAATRGPAGDPFSLWTGEAGESLSALFSSLLDDARLFPPLKPADYPPLIGSLLQAIPVRPRYGRHPRLAILGLLEARLVQADVTILGGLNDGRWPAEAETDPWLSRPQRSTLGLPLPDRRIGLAAHDFAQGLAKETVYLTWSKKIASQPAIPSRWVLRLTAFLKAAGCEEAISPSEPWLEWVLGLDRPNPLRAVGRPRPRPPVSARPRQLSVTGVDELLKDPYAVFARRILKLTPLDPLDVVLGRAERGLFVHAVLSRFTKRTPGPLPSDAAHMLLDEARAVFAEMEVDEPTAAFWWPQMERIAHWFASSEQALRETAAAQHAEVDGRLDLQLSRGGFTLTCRADRIDLLNDGGLRIIDYKTGAPPSFKEQARNFSAQLLLEAHVAAAGGFAGLAAMPASNLLYIRLSGGEPAGELVPCKDDVATLAEATAEKLKRLLDLYGDEATPYEAKDWSGDPDREGDFGHLSRWREWAVTGTAKAGP